MTHHHRTPETENEWRRDVLWTLEEIRDEQKELERVLGEMLMHLEMLSGHPSDINPLRFRYK